ncbi:unnamed protein product [Arctogadus glacialis]
MSTLKQQQLKPFLKFELSQGSEEGLHIRVREHLRIQTRAAFSLPDCGEWIDGEEERGPMECINRGLATQ